MDAQETGEEGTTDLEPFNNQVAGHMGPKTGSIMRYKDTLVKTMVKKKYHDREVEFYESLQNAEKKSLIELKTLVPNYFGTKILPINGEDVECIVLEDLTKGMEEPCIMDIKIGRITWDPEASPQKRVSEEKKYAQVKRDLGFCIPGFQVYRIRKTKWLKLGKDFGKSMTKDTVEDALETFLNLDAGYCHALLIPLLAQLWKILHWAKTQRCIRLFSSSILLVYDAKRLKDEISHSKEAEVNSKSSNCNHQDVDEKSENWVVVKMIDFTHVFLSEDEEIDRNYLDGIENLVKIIENFLETSKC